jgi:hypothetical protein
VADAMFSGASAFNQDLSGWCVQANFDSEPINFITNSNNAAWVNETALHPVWDGADGSGANCD